MLMGTECRGDAAKLDGGGGGEWLSEEGRGSSGDD